MRTDFVKIEDLDTLGRNVNKMFSDTVNFSRNKITELLKPFGMKGLDLNEGCENSYVVMAEIKPKVFKQVLNVRYNINADCLEMLVEDEKEYRPLAFVAYDFLWDEILLAYRQEVENITSDFHWDYQDFEKIWIRYRSFNELLGSAKMGYDEMTLLNDVDDYNNNTIAIFVQYKDKLKVEFTYLMNESHPFKVTKIEYDNFTMEID